jgi:hypothetical protein
MAIPIDEVPAVAAKLQRRILHDLLPDGRYFAPTGVFSADVLTKRGSLKPKGVGALKVYPDGHWADSKNKKSGKDIVDLVAHVNGTSRSAALAKLAEVLQPGDKLTDRFFTVRDSRWVNPERRFKSRKDKGAEYNDNLAKRGYSPQERADKLLKQAAGKAFYNADNAAERHRIISSLWFGDNASNRRR